MCDSCNVLHQTDTFRKKSFLTFFQLHNDMKCVTCVTTTRLVPEGGERCVCVCVCVCDMK